MKILFLSNLYPPHYQGGYELRCSEIVDGLASRGHEVIVVTSTHGVPSAGTEGHVHRVLRFLRDEITTEQYANKMKRPWAYVAAQMKIASISRSNAQIVAEIVNQSPPDVAYIWNLYGLTISPLAPLVKNHIPRVFSLGDRWPIQTIKYYTSRGRIRRLVRRTLIGAGHHENLLRDGIFLPNSNCLREEYLMAGVPEGHIFVLPRGVQVPEQLPPLQKSDTFRMLYAGRLCDNKGVRVAIKAAGELRDDPNIQPFALDIAGSGEEEYISTIKKEIEALGLSANVKLLGMLPWDELEKERRNHQAFIFPSMWIDPFPVALLEAMASGLPVVGSPVGGAAEIMEDEMNALTFPPGDYKALAASIKRLMDDRELLMRLREGGWQTVKEKYDFDKLLSEHEKYLQLAIDRSDNTLPASCNR